MFKHNHGECFLVCIEGIDKVGKHTQATLLERSLSRRMIKSMMVEVPWNDGVVHTRIAQMLKSGDAKRYPVVFQTLQATNRRLMQANYLPNLTLHFDVVILDRWTPSAWAYGAASGITPEQNKVILEGLVPPDLTIILDGKPFEDESEKDSYESDREFQEAVRKRYQEYQSLNPDTTVMLNANQSISFLSRQVLETMSKHYAKQGSTIKV